MKKIFILVVLVNCIYFSACGNKIIDNNEKIIEENQSEQHTELSDEDIEISEEKMQQSYYELARKQYIDKEYISVVNTINLGCNGYDPDGLMEKARNEIDKIRSYASATYLHSERDVVFINENRTLSVAGRAEYISTLEWNDLKKIELMGYRLVGLKNNGTVKVSDYYWEADFFSNAPQAFVEKVECWTDIVDIAVITSIDNSYIFGLKADGTVVVACKNEDNNLYSEVESWTNVTKIVGNNTTYGLYGLTAEGNLLYTSEYIFENVGNIVDIDSDSFSLLVTQDSIDAKGIFFASPTDINFKNIIDVEVGTHYAAFLYDNGKVMYWSIDSDEVVYIEKLNNVAAISGTSDFIVAYKCNNDVVIIGDTEKTDVVGGDGIEILDMKLYSRNQNSSSNEVTTTPKEYEPTIGMTKEEVVLSNWGEPKKKNITEAYWGTHEQWVYSIDRYVYFENGIVTAIQKSE